MNKTHKIKPSVLKAYDIRGIVDKEIFNRLLKVFEE